MKLGSIQFLRAIAATLVVYAHSIDLTQRFGKPWQGSFRYLSDVGCIGVDIFFVISGFIITHVAARYNGLEKGVLFLQKRFIRINPIYYIASLLYIGCHLLTTWVQYHRLPVPVSILLTNLADTLLIVPTAPDTKGYAPLLMIGWTLAFEWLFYIVFFIAIVSPTSRKILLLLSIIATLILCSYWLLPIDLRLTFLTNPIMLEFMMGVLLCQTYLHIKKVPSFAAIALLITGLVWYGVLIFYNNPQIANISPILTGRLSLQRAVYWGIPSACIVAGCVFLEKNGYLNRLWNNRWSQLTGDASYSIYLVHFSVFSLFTLLYRQSGFFLPADLSIFFQVVVALVISLFFYRWVERPLLRWLHKVTSKPGLPKATALTAQAATTST